MLRVGVFGAGGRMGSTVCRAVADDPALELVAAVDPHHSGLDLRQVTGVDLVTAKKAIITFQLDVAQRHIAGVEVISQ